MNKEKKQKKEKGAHVSFRSMIIAMIIALLAFIGIGNFDLGNGDGADVSEENGIISQENTDVVSDEVADNNNETSEDSNEIPDESINEKTGFTIYLRGEKIYIDSADDAKEVTLSYIETKLNSLEADTVVYIYDEGATNKAYEEIKELINELNLPYKTPNN